MVNTWSRLVPVMPTHYMNNADSSLINIFQWNFIWNKKVYIQENALENVSCKMMAICFKKSFLWTEV